MILYHVTSRKSAEQIVASGFIDLTDYYMTNEPNRPSPWTKRSAHRGVAG
jgi:hypothetical protein